MTEAWLLLAMVLMYAGLSRSFQFVERGKTFSGSYNHDLTFAKYILPKYDLIVKGRSLCHCSFGINNTERKRNYKVMIAQIIILHEL